MPIPSKTWDDIIAKPRYPQQNVTYTLKPTMQMPIEDKQRNGRYILKTDQGPIWLWEATLVELAILMRQNDYKDCQVIFERDAAGKTHPRLVIERLDQHVEQS